MKQGWEYKKLGEVCDVRDGTHDSPKYQLKGIPLVTSKNIVNGQLDLSTANLISYEDAESINKRSKVDNGDIIMPMIGTIGNPLLLEHIDFTFCIKNVALIKFNKDSKIYNKYLLYYLKSPLFDIYVKQKNKGGTQKFLSLGILRDMSIPVPPLTTQQSIVSELDTLSQIIADYKEQLADYDKLEQSIFYDMFGDPVKNEKGWEVKKFGQIFKLKSGDGLSTKDFIYGEIPVYGGNGISGYHNQSNRKGKFIIIGRVGAYCGNVRCVEGEFWLTDNAFELFFDIKSFDFQWLNRMLNTINLQQYANHAAQPVISNNGLKDIDVIIPPLPLQQQFASKIESIEQMKADTKAALQDAELLFNARMDYWFNA